MQNFQKKLKMLRRDFILFPAISVGLFWFAKDTFLFEEPLTLDDFGGPLGSITPFKGGTYSDIYFGAYIYAHALELGITCPHVEKFIEWSASLQEKNGFFSKVCQDKATAALYASCGRADSNDATLSKWLEMFELHPNASTLKEKYKSQLQKAESALFSLKRKNGLYGVFPRTEKGYENYCLFKDNIEVLRYLKIKAVKSNSTKHEQMYKELLDAIKQNFGPDLLTPQKLVVGAEYDREMFYPHKVAAPFVLLENILTTAESEKFNWSAWLHKNEAAWNEQARIDFPWGTVALAALTSGRPDIAKKWIETYYDIEKDQPKAGVRWNVLEEFSAFVIKKKLY